MSAEEHVVLKEPNGLSWRRCKQLQLAPASILSAFQALPDMNLLEPVAQPVAEAQHAQASSNPLLKPKAPTKALKPLVKEAVPTILRNIVPTPDYRPRSRMLSSSLQTYMQSAEAPPVLNVYVNKQAEIESNSPYLTDVTYYTPQSRRSFYRFIKESYTDSFKPPVKVKGPPDQDACKKLDMGGKAVEAFLYQKFIREYIRNAGPYRGILVYHGLGSGKTCSSIAAAEALYGTANKKIIVMTPSSLRPNFINEVSFCGFRHFNVNNCWEAIAIPSEPGPRYVPLKSSMEYLYATEVLSLSEEYMKKYSTIWVPNFEKTDESDPTHYKRRSQPERDAILRQVTHIIENRITFISYNGISAAKLKSFAAPDSTGKRMFDDAVIVIDEVHNLTRLMQGNITQYIVERKKKKKGEEVTEDLSEPIVPGRWVPKLLNRHEPYKRAYLFYKLLTDARNSKIIGLSGTPIINFPEELGIMANLLAGYTECAEFTIYTVKEEVIHQLKTLIEKEPRVDIVRFSRENQSTKVLISVFQEGYQRSAEYSGGGVGVEYNEDAQEDIMTIYPRIKAVIQPVLQGLGIRMEEPASEMAQMGSSHPSRNGPYVSYPRLPIDDETFRKEFINIKGADEKNVIANRTVLQKRLTGLISYYKGSKEDYMPRVTDHGVEACPMSDYVLSKYTEERGREIAIEKQQGTKTSPSLFEAVDMFSKMKNPSNYRFRSRSLCNFAFPKTITRPFPNTKEELESETTEPVAEPVYSEEAGELPAEEATIEERAVIEQEEQQAEEVLEEDEKTEGGGEDVQGDVQGDVQEDVQGDVQEEYKDSMVGGMDPPVPVKRKPRMGTLPSAALPSASAALPALPSAPSAAAVPAREPSKAADFQRQIKAAMQALEDAKNEYLNLDDVVPERSLHHYSTKMDRMLRNINHSNGSNLVYSQFKTVEGIGAFGVALKANGYVEIVIEGSDAAPRFSQQTADSLRKGPAAKERRFITFTGEGSKERRTLILNVFNGNFDKLPSDMRDIMLSSGYGENKNQTGDVCWVIGITGAGAEGISLKCCRSVHIMEPFWNNVRLEQVKGRAIRICSHMDLPVQDRHVDIYTYVTTFSMEQLRKKEGGVDTTIRTRDTDPTSNGERVLTSDENVLRVSTKKEEINQAILTVMKETAVDCGLNVADNQVACVEFNGKPDQYMFDPDLKVDKIVSSTDFKQQEVESVDEVKDSEDVTLVGYRGKRYLMHSKNGRKKASAVIYMFAETDTKYEKPLGEADIHPMTGAYYNYHLYE